MKIKTQFFLRTISILSIAFILAGCIHNPQITSVEIQQSQDAYTYLDPKTATKPLLSFKQQQRTAKKYLKNYFSPWEKKNNFDKFKLNPGNTISILEEQQKAVTKQKEKPGWGENLHRYSPQWFDELSNRMNFNTYPNRDRRAIVINNTNIREFPTDKPIFGDFRLAGEGFPFDYAQFSSLWVGTPLHVSHLSKDGEWALIVSSTVYGWVHLRDIAYVSEDFVNKWKTKNYATLIKNYVPIKDRRGNFRFDGRLGSLFPVSDRSLLIPVKTSDRYAVIRKANLDPKNYAKFPWRATPKHFSMLINELVGENYGWGGMFGNRDCSQLLLDLYAPFGFWLPRNSSNQQNNYSHVDVSNLSPQEKQKFIKENGKPYLTLIGLRGHIMFYLGEYQKENQPELMVFHDAWGIRTTDLLRHQGRAVIGKAVITPLMVDKKISHVAKPLLNKVTTVTFVGEKG